MRVLQAAEALGREESRMTCFSCCKVDEEPEESVRKARIRRQYSSGLKRLTSLVATFSVKSGRKNTTDFLILF